MCNYVFLTGFIILCFSVVEYIYCERTSNSFLDFYLAKNEQDKQILKNLRRKLSNLNFNPLRSTVAGSLILGECTDITKYTVDEINKTITRVGHNGYTNEYFAALNRYIDLKSQKSGTTQVITFNLSVTNLGDGLIFFGGCRAPKLTTLTSKTCKASDGIMFTGLSVIYFGDQCYHLDAFSENNYVLSVRTCLSEYTVKNINFLVKITYIPVDLIVYPIIPQFLYVEVSFDGEVWFTSKDYGINPESNTDKTSLPILGKIFPCVWMFVDGTAVKISNLTP